MGGFSEIRLESWQYIQNNYNVIKDKPFFWSPNKIDQLKQERGFGFEDVVEAIDGGGLLDDLCHPSDRYRNQRLYLVNLNGHAIIVPYVEDEDCVFLKTAFPSRKATKKYFSWQTMTQPNEINLDPKPLDDEERGIIDAFENGLDDGTFVSELTGERRTKIEASAHVTMKPPKAQITTRLAKHDLSRLKARALELGMPYQTLLASIVHQYVERALVEKKMDG